MNTATGRGFTVIELLAALAIIGILTGIALPAWNRFFPSFALSRSARLVHSELQSIKIRAAAENVSYRLIYGSESNRIAIQREGRIWAIKALAPGVTISKHGSITFSPRGTASSNRVQLKSRNGDCRQVVVSATGRVRSCKTACQDNC